MTLMVLLVGIFILGTCLAFFVSPSLVEELIVWLGRQRNLYGVVALRFALFMLRQPLPRAMWRVWGLLNNWTPTIHVLSA